MALVGFDPHQRVHRTARYALALVLVLLLLLVTSTRGAAQTGAAPTAWTESRGGLTNAGVVGGTLIVRWTYRSPSTVRGIAVTNDFVALGTEPVDADKASFQIDSVDRAGTLILLSTHCGAELWSRDVPSWIHGDPLIYDGKVYATFGRIPFAEIGGVRAFRIADGDSLWTHWTQAGVMPAGAIDTAARTITIAGADRTVRVLALRDGSVREVASMLDAVNMSSVRLDSDGVAYLGARQRVAAFDTRHGRLLWRRSFDWIDGIGDVPVAVGDTLAYTTGVEEVGIRTLLHGASFADFRTWMIAAARTQPWFRHAIWFQRQWLLAVNRRSGAVAWIHDLGAGPATLRNTSGSPVVRGGRVFVASPISRRLFAFNGATGRVAWEHSLDTPAFGAPLVAGGDVIVGDVAGTMRLFNAETGELLGSCSAGAPFTVTSPVLVGQTVFVALKGGLVYARPYAELRQRLSRHASRCFI